MSFFKSTLLIGAFIISTETFAASAVSVKQYEGDIPYETVKFFSPYSAFFKDDAKRAGCKKVRIKIPKESTQLNLEVKFPEKPDAEDQKTAGKENLRMDFITPVMTNVPSYEN